MTDEKGLMPVTPRASEIEGFFEKDRLTQMMVLAQSYHKAGCFGADVKNAEMALVKIQAGFEMGMPPMEAMNSLYIVNGHITIWGVAMAKRLRLKGWKITYDETKPGQATVTITKDDEVYSYTATVEELVALRSKAAGFAQKDKLKWHALSRIIRFYVPEILDAGVGYMKEELEDLPGATVFDVTPNTQDASVMGIEEARKIIRECATDEELKVAADKIMQMPWMPDELQDMRNEAIAKRKTFVVPAKETTPEMMKNAPVQAAAYEAAIDKAKVEVAGVDESPVEIGIDPAEPGTDVSVESVVDAETGEVIESKAVEPEAKPKPKKLSPWTMSKLKSTVENLKTTTEVKGLKDEMVQLYNDGEITNAFYQEAVEECQRRTRQITKKMQEAVEPLNE